MSIELPDSAKQVSDKMKTDVQRELQSSNPFTRNHWLGAGITAAANRIFDFYQQLLIAVDLNVPDTATGIYLERWESIFEITPLAATQATGNVVATGTVSANVPSGTILVDSDNNTFTVTDTVVIATTTIFSVVLARSGQVVTATTPANHNYASGLIATLDNAVDPAYNAPFEITVINDTQFQFEVIGSPAASDTCDSTATFISVPIEADVAGAAGNQDNGVELTLQQPLTGVDEVLTVDAGDIGGGSDLEEEDATRDRLLSRIRNPVAHFNPADIERLVFTVNGVTRVFVQTPSSKTTQIETTVVQKEGPFALLTTNVTIPFFDGQLITTSGSADVEYNLVNVTLVLVSATQFGFVVGETAADPTDNTITVFGSVVPLGTVRVYFMRDNDADPIPSASEVQTVFDLLLSILPANTAESDMVVAGPVANAIDFTFSQIAPDTDTMRASIKAQLQEMMATRTVVDGILDSTVYNAVIGNTFDETEGEFLESFMLSTPTGNVGGTTGEIVTLGIVTIDGDVV